MRLHIPIPLRWGDLDAFNHVNNAAMLGLLEEARVRVFWRPGSGEQGPPTAILDPSLDSGLLTLIARHEIEYLAPVPYGRHPLDVQLWFGRLGGSSVEVYYEVRAPVEEAVEGEQTLYVRAATTIVLVKADTGWPVRLTAREREAWEPYVEQPVAFRRR